MKPSQIEILPPLNKVQLYRVRYTLLLSSVPVFCAIVLTGVLFLFAQLNLYFLETGGLVVNEAIRQAYFDQIMMEFGDVWQLLAALWAAAIIVSWFMMSWATSPFVQGEKLLRLAIGKKSLGDESNLWLSESPDFTRVVCRLGRRLEEPTFAFDDFPEATYQFNFIFFAKFLLVFYLISLITGYVLTSVFDAVYLKNVSLALNLIKMREFGHYFVAQENILRNISWSTCAISCLAYFIIGVSITRYMSNMQFVFKRAIRERHFPLRLRDSDIYHSFAATISELAELAGLSKPRK